jgi:transposase InsO family protein
MKYAFMATHEKEFSVKLMCRVLGLKRSGYYAWRNRPLSARAKANEELLEQIREAFDLCRKVYGSPRIRHYLVGKGHACGRHRVARLMKQAHLVAKRAYRRHPQTTQQCPGARIAPNLLSQDFSASKPNEKWVGDITYIDTAEGWLYLASIMDLYSRRIVGWSMADRMDVCLVENAWKMAVTNRQPTSNLLHHTDRGSQYTSEAYRALLATRQIQVSMSRTGNCYDNAAMESFHATLKGECAFTQFKTKAEAKTTIFEFIEAWYNRQRLHSTLGYQSPSDFEQLSDINRVH